MQISTKGNGDLIRVSGVSRCPGFELTGLYCSSLQVKFNLNLVFQFQNKNNTKQK